MMASIILKISLAALLSLVSIAVVLKWGGSVTPVDHENHRSLHHGKIPRSGGVGIVIGSSWALWQFAGLGMAGREGLMVVSVALLVFVSLVDDFRHLPFWLRLLVQSISAVFILMWMGGLSEGPVFWLIPVWLLIIWSINLYNFMDGMDGLAGSMAVIGFSVLGLLGWFSRQPGYTLLMFSVVAATLGFLVFNWPPAKIFMGDVGSTFLGYMMAAASLWGIERGIFPVWVPLLIFLPFWLDATVTLLRRVVRGERFWEAHREHFYQRAVLSGVPVRRVLLVEVALMITTSSLAILGWLSWLSG